VSPPHPALLRVAAGAEAGRIADEAAFVRSTHEHRMVARVLDSHELGEVVLSPDSITALAIQDLAERQFHLELWGALERIQAALQPMGAEVAVLKGIATETRWYDDIGQRACTDLDLLLAPRALGRAAEVVVTLDPTRGCSAAISDLVPRRLLQHVDLQYGDVAVDLHFDPLKIGLPTLQLEAVWESTELCDTPHGTIRVLAAEIELVLLLLHMNKDGFALLGSFLDIQRLVQRAPLDWDRVRGFVTAEGLDIPVWKSLRLVDAQVGLGDIEVPSTGGVRAWTWDRLWGRSILRGEGKDGALSVQPLLPLHVAGRSSDNRRELRRQLAPPRRLLEVAGRLKPGESYLRWLGIGRVQNRLRPRPGNARQSAEVSSQPE